MNPYTFNTQSAPASKFTRRRLANNQLKNTPYIKALTQYSSPPYYLQNYGLKTANHSEKGQFLTIDMCPATTKPFEKKLFELLVNLSKQNHKPTPISLSISGLWIISHPKEFEWFIQQEKRNKLKITWINHTYNHFYDPSLPLEKNFLLATNTNIRLEILNTEKLLLEHHQLPSVFFRFPGLIANQDLILKIHHFGLIPIGSNAWLAKNEIAKNGSIILIHGNSNEPIGVYKMMQMIESQHLTLLPLSKAYQ